ncbi:hypothetical protein BHE74_00049198 [Ensete ventricosum]|nr:hypothetical protein BHE74_00049198 [Ensete ventricosum]
MQHGRSCPVRDKIIRRYDHELLGALLWYTTQQEEVLWIQGVNVMAPQRRVFVCASELTLDENLALVISIWGLCMIRAAGELDCFSAHIRLREPGKSEDKADPVGLSYPKAKRRLERMWTRRSTPVPQRRIYRSRRKGCRCKSTNSRAMGLAAPWYRRGGTSMESSIPCSHGGRALVIKGVEELENAKANSKYQDRVEAKKLHKTDIEGLLIKIAESEGLRVGTGVLDQGTK